MMDFWLVYFYVLFGLVCFYFGLVLMERVGLRDVCARNKEEIVTNSNSASAPVPPSSSQGVGVVRFLDVVVIPGFGESKPLVPNVSYDLPVKFKKVKL